MTEKKYNNICYFEIGSTNLVASKEFYSTCFEWTFQDAGPDYSMFNTGDTSGGISTNIKPTSDGTKLVINTENIAEKMKSIVAAGGDRVGEIVDIGNEMGFYQYFKDNCGNQLALWAPTN